MKIKVRFLKKALAAFLSFAMASTIVPEIWLPVHAEMVRNEIIDADINTAESEADNNTDNNIESNSEESFSAAPAFSGEAYQKYYFNGNEYAVIDDPSMTWTDAKAFCESIGGHLVTVSSQQENDFIGDIIKNGYREYYWIGLTRSGSSWNWVTNEPFTYSNWDSGEPNNQSNIENYAHIYKDSGASAKKWNDTIHDRGCGLVCEWDGADLPEEPEIKENSFDYVLFSGNQNQPLNLNGWKGNFTGNIYSGQDFVTYLSEFFVDGKIDAVGRITAGGWMTEISERNENAETVAMPDFDAIIEENAQPIEYLSGSPAYIQDKTVINGGIKSEGNINISGTYFEGDCYIIAEGDITYNVMSLQTTGRVFLYSKNGNISISGSQIELNGILYAPNGRVTFNTYDTTINGCVWADTISFNGSIFNVRGANFDMVEPKYNGVVKTYTTDADFSEGTLEGTSLNIPNQLILAEKSDGDAVPYEKIYGDTESGKGVKVTYSADKSAVSGIGDNITVSYDLSGFGSADINENAVDLIIVVDESGSMAGARTSSAKAAAKEVISHMKENDRCGCICQAKNQPVVINENSATKKQ